jgi:mRNA deadenylase 3'-5' endonuclease subunit Ccr4
MQAADDLSFAFTNYVKGYQAALDYIWYESPKLRVTRCLDMPDESLVRDTYCPSAVYPSDHLAVVCDMEYV